MLLQRAQIQGLDPVEVLHKAGLILSPSKAIGLQVLGMKVILESLRSWRPVELLRRKFVAHHPVTAADMYTVIIEFIEEHVSEVKKNDTRRP